MSIPLFDVQTGFGGVKCGTRAPVGRAALLEEMGRLDIARSLVRIVPGDLDLDVTASNRELLESCALHPGLIPCPAVVPNTAADLPTEEEQLAQALEGGAGAVVLRPSRDGWLLAEWACSELMRALASARVPTIVSEKSTPLRELAEFADRYPEIPFIVIEANYRSQRTYLSFLKAFPNTHISMGSNYIVHVGIEQVVHQVGPERLLFGTGFPEAEAMSAITHLMYADLADDDKALIGAGNFDRLMEGIRR